MRLADELSKISRTRIGLTAETKVSHPVGLESWAIVKQMIDALAVGPTRAFSRLLYLEAVKVFSVEAMTREELCCFEK